MQTEQLKVTGMTCGGCTSSVGHALKAVNGVNDGYGIETTNPSPAPKGKSGCCG
jgi:copper chaperone CopZ